MEEHFPVNSGNVPPPSQSTNLLSHQLANNNNSNVFQMSNGLRRKPKEALKSSSKLKLERILGLTSTSNNILSTANDLIAYAAGAVVVIYNYKRNKQVGFLYPPPSPVNTSQQQNNNNSTNDMNLAMAAASAATTPLITPLGNNTAMLNTNEIPGQNGAGLDDKKQTPASTRAKPISCLTFSPDGNYLAVGEMGHQPRIFIWNIKEKKLLREIRCHKFGILSLSFSPNMRYLVSVGFQHDGYLYVWDWKKGIQLAANKVTSRVNAISFSKDGSYFVTAGLRHVKFWYLDARGRIPKRGNSRETQVLDGRSGILGVLRDANFIDVACDQNSNTTYFITDSGILCIFKEGRVIDKWVDLQVKNAYSIAVSSNYVICTCSEGVIRLFEPVTLKYAGILPKPHPLGEDISSISSPEMLRSSPQDKPIYYPDAVATVYDESTHRVIAVYADRSLYVWDIRDLNKIGKYRSFIFHSDCVWGAEPCPSIEREDIPSNSFATFSADGTIRIWNLDNPLHASTSSSPLSPNIMSPSSSTAVVAHRRNIYSRELVKMLYVDPDAAEFAKRRNEYESNDDHYPDFGIRSLRISTNGQLLASGDRNGNLRVHDTNTWEMLTYQEAHDSEILAIDMTTPKDKDAPSLVATASRDRLLHVFDIKSNYQLVQSLDDHSSSITSVRFSKDASRLISCGADKGIIFRNRVHPVTPFYDTTHPRPFTTYHNYSGRSTVFDMSLDINDRYIATVTGERKLYVFSIESGKPFRICKPDMTAEDNIMSGGGSLINIDLDPFSGTYAVTSGSDRCLRLFDLTNSTCIEKVCAHAELITSVKFIRTNVEEDGLRVVSTCSDGTIFIWRVSQDIVSKMCARAIERDSRLKQQQPTKQQRIRRVSVTPKPTASISQMIRHNERKTFSTMSTAEQKYDELYKKIAASQQRKVPTTRPPPVELNNTKLDRLYNGLPTHNKTPMQYVNANIRTPPRSNPVLRRAVSRDGFVTTPTRKEEQPPLLRKSPTPKLHSSPKRRASQPLSNSKKESQMTLDSKHTNNKPILLSEDSSSSDTDMDIKEEDEEPKEDVEEDEDEEDDESEEEIIFTPEQDKISKPFEVSMHPTLNDDDYEEVVTTSDNDDDEEEEELSSEDNVDDAIHRDIIALEPPRVSTSLSRTTSTKIIIEKVSTTPKRHKKKEKKEDTKRQSITARFLSSLTRPSIEQIMSAFEGETNNKKEEEKYTIDVAPPNHIPPPSNILPSPPQSKHTSPPPPNTPPPPLSNTTPLLPQSNNTPPSPQSNNTPPTKEQQEDEEEKLESALGDLDGIHVLLDSVIDTFTTLKKTSHNQDKLHCIENKLISMHNKINQVVQQQDPTSTLSLLEKYSNLLVDLVDKKLKK